MILVLLLRLNAQDRETDRHTDRQTDRQIDRYQIQHTQRETD